MNPQTYTIKSGDTLSGIASKSGISMSAILAANPYITDPNKIFAGKTLTIPVKQATPTTIQTTTSTRTQDQTNLNKFNAVTQAIQANNALTTPASTTPTGTQTTTDVQNGNTNAQKPVQTVQSLYLSGNGSAEDIYNKLIQDPANGTLTLDQVKATVQGLSADPSSLAQHETTSALSRLESDRASIKATFDEMKKTLDAENAAAVESINSTFEKRRNQMTATFESLKANRAKAGYLADSFRYTPQQMEGIVTNDEQNHITRLTEIDAEQKALLAQAATAKRQADWELLTKMMGQYDKNDTERSNLIGRLVTISQQTNKKLETEQKIADKANAVPKASDAKTLAAAVAPAIREAIAGMSVLDKATYIKEKATALKIDPDVLKGAVIVQEDKEDMAAQKLAKEKALTAKALRVPVKATGSGGKGGTVTERKNASFGDLDSIVSKNPSVNGIPIKDVNGFLNPKSFEALISWGAKRGITRKDIVTRYPNIFYTDNIEAYGLTPAEKKILGI